MPPLRAASLSQFRIGFIAQLAVAASLLDLSMKMHEYCALLQ